MSLSLDRSDQKTNITRLTTVMMSSALSRGVDNACSICVFSQHDPVTVIRSTTLPIPGGDRNGVTWKVAGMERYTDNSLIVRPMTIEEAGSEEMEGRVKIEMRCEE